MKERLIKIKFENTEVFNFEGALRGMRNPMNSWDKSDSYFFTNRDPYGDESIEEFKNRRPKAYVYNNCANECYSCVDIGENDLKLAQSLIKAGSDHSKYLRQILVSVDITAPLYWWKEFDTYKVGTVANSTSTMHKLASTKITSECFEFDSVTEMFGDTDTKVSEALCNLLENYRQEYLRTNDKRVWRALIQLLPSAWLQTRTVTMSYQNIRAMFFARRNHKLSEWSADFIEWVRSLPYAEELIMFGGA